MNAIAGVGKSFDLWATKGANIFRRVEPGEDGWSFDLIRERNNM